MGVSQNSFSTSHPFIIFFIFYEASFQTKIQRGHAELKTCIFTYHLSFRGNSTWVGRIGHAAIQVMLFCVELKTEGILLLWFSDDFLSPHFLVSFSKEKRPRKSSSHELVEHQPSIPSRSPRWRPRNLNGPRIVVNFGKKRPNCSEPAGAENWPSRP